MIENVQQIPLKKLHENPANPRRRFGDMAELVASVAKVGVLQPLMARPKNGGYELVFGHRRLRAAAETKLLEVPVIVRELSDLEALECALVENVARADIHPLEEAEGFRQLHEVHKHPVEEIAAKVGRSVAYVYARLKLCALTPKCREAFFKGELAASTALLVARIPVPSLQDGALNAVMAGDYRGPMSTRQAAEYIEDHYMLRLGEAPFDRADAKLLPSAGACTGCPKRTGNQRELFSDIKSADVCTDPVCFGQKREAAWTQQAAEAEAKGLIVLTDKETKKVFPYRHSGVASESGFVDLEQECWDDSKNRKWKQLVGKDKVRVTLARDQEGKVHRLVDKREALKAAKDQGHLKEARQASTSPLGASEKKQREKDLVHRAAVGTALAAIVAATEKKEPTEAWWRFLAEHVIREFWRDVASHVCKRRGVEIGKKQQPGQEIAKLAKTASVAQLRGLLLEMVCSRDAYASHYCGDREKVIADACKLFRIDWATHVADAAAERKAKKAPPKGKAAK